MEKNKNNISVINYIKESDHVDYILEITYNNEKFTIKERYSNLRELNNNLIKEYKKNKKKFPIFPPKKLFNNESESFLIQRQKGLNNYFNEIFNNEEFSNLNSLKSFIDYCKEKYEKENNNIKKKNSYKKFDKANVEKIFNETQKKFIFIDVPNSIINTNDKYNKILKQILNPYFFEFKNIPIGNDNNFKFLEKNISEEKKINNIEINLKNKINIINNFNYNKTENIIIPFK